MASPPFPRRALWQCSRGLDSNFSTCTCHGQQGRHQLRRRHKHAAWDFTHWQPLALHSCSLLLGSTDHGQKPTNLLTKVVVSDCVSAVPSACPVVER